MRSNQETFKSVHAFFTWDHRRLEDQLVDVVKHVDGGDLERARRLWGHYARGMRRHMRIEEEAIFQLYAFDRTGEAKSPATAISAEHAEMAKGLDEMEAALRAEDVPRFRATHTAFVAFLPVHHEREELALYPYLDSLLGAVEAEKLVARLRAE